MSDISQRLANLSPQQLERLAHLLARKQAAAPPAQAISRRKSTGPAPLSFAQRRMWILYQLDPGSAAFNISIAMRLRGPLNLKALERSLFEVVRRHDSLRTSFDEVNGEPVQIVNELREWSLPKIDLLSIPADKRWSEMGVFAKAEAMRPFDLRVGPLLRTALVQLAEDDHVLIVVVHHIISDGWSMSVLMGEIGQLYDAYSRGEELKLPELPLQYTDYAQWQKEWLASDACQAQLKYWRDQLAGAPPFLELQSDWERPVVLSQKGADQLLILDDELARATKDLAKNSGVTLFTLTLAVFNVLLFRYSGREDIVVGTNVANRNRGAIQKMIGFFVNNLVLRTDLSGDPTFRECLARVNAVTLDAHAHQDVPFELLVEELRPQRVRNHTPLFQVLFLYQKNGPLTSVMGELEFSVLNIFTGTSTYDLMMIVEEGEIHELYLHLSYSTDLFAASTINRMLQHYENLLRSIVANPDEHIAALSMSSDKEDAQLLDSFNAALGDDN
jgi:Condensation domain